MSAIATTEALAPRLHPQTAVGPVALFARDIATLSAWYRQVLGLAVLAEGDDRTVLGAADGTPLLTLVSRPQARPAARRSPGLYHIAILLPTRGDLGRWLGHAAGLGVRLQGASDHLVSEAVYLADPEGNGIEVYRDRPRADWPMEGGKVAMGTLALDIDGVVKAAQSEGRPWTGAPAGTVVGHVHLKVAGIASSRAFYEGKLGFDVMVDAIPTALFIAAGGYHHHLGLNVWESRGGQRDPEAAGLAGAVIMLPPAALAALAERLRGDADLVAEQVNGHLSVVDPSGNRLVFAAGPIGAAEAMTIV